MTTTRLELDEGLIEALRRSHRVVVLTGAGVSAESGVPTFRDAQTGLWARYDPEQLATPEAFRRDPELVWRWYLWRRELVEAAQPNPGHVALAELEARLPGLVLVTQNVDGLHRRAGSRRVIELHGDLTRNRCVSCSRSSDGPFDLAPGVPRCAVCGDLLRPDVVWFGEMLPAAAMAEATAAARASDAFLSVGTSSLVFPAAALPYEALTGGATVVEVNPQPTPLTPRVHHAVHGPAGVALPALFAAVWPAV
jgi:NAD-dependent deacetylase